MVLSDKEAKFIAILLDMAKDEFANHGCNDLSDELRNFFTKEEQDKLNRDMHNWNGDPEEYRRGEPLMNYDWLWMSFFAGKLRGEIR